MKTLVFGPENAGKTSLLRTTCDGYSYMRVINIPPTRGVSRENYLFRGLLELTLWDAGGQKKYRDRYFSDRKEIIFSEVKIPIFMVDCSVKKKNQKEIFDKFLKNLLKYSPHIDEIYVLINKTDLESANPDRTYKILTKDLNQQMMEKCKFTPVSVKEGTAQHRLIEILDESLQKSVLDLERMAKIRKVIDKMKEDTNANYFIINRRDGLVITSTLGKVDTDPINFISLDTSSIESNIDYFIQSIQERMGKEMEAVFLKSYIYETHSQYIILQELDDFTEIMAITEEKTPKKLIEIIQQLDEESKIMKKLVEVINSELRES